MATIPTIPTEEVVGALLQVFTIISTAFVVVQITLLLAKKLITEWRETRDQLKAVRTSVKPKELRADHDDPGT